MAARLPGTVAATERQLRLVKMRRELCIEHGDAPGAFAAAGELDALLEHLSALNAAARAKVSA